VRSVCTVYNPPILHLVRGNCETEQTCRSVSRIHVPIDWCRGLARRQRRAQPQVMFPLETSKQVCTHSSDRKRGEQAPFLASNDALRPARVIVDDRVLPHVSNEKKKKTFHVSAFSSTVREPHFCFIGGKLGLWVKCYRKSHKIMPRARKQWTYSAISLTRQRQ